jgi:hypothetical protein
VETIFEEKITSDEIKMHISRKTGSDSVQESKMSTLIRMKPTCNAILLKKRLKKAPKKSTVQETYGCG